jgi:hypothetical protein
MGNARIPALIAVLLILFLQQCICVYRSAAWRDAVKNWNAEAVTKLSRGLRGWHGIRQTAKFGAIRVIRG